MSPRRAARTRRRRRLLTAAALAAVALTGCAAAGDPGADPAADPATQATTRATTQPSPSSPTGTPGTPSPAPTAADPVRTIAISVRGRSVTPAPDVVDLRRGERLRLVVTSDHDDQLHAHGFDVETPLTAGRPTTVELTGAEPGRYEVETHHPSLRLLVVQVR